MPHRFRYLAAAFALVLAAEYVLRRFFTKRLLTRTRLDAPLQYAIARISGYPNTNTFFIAFRKAMKQTPAEFRNAARRGQRPVL